MGKYDYLIAGRTQTARTGGKYDYLITAKKPVSAPAAPVRRTGVLGGLQELESDVRRVVTAPFPKQSWNPMEALKTTYKTAKDTLGNSFIDRPKAALSAIFDRNSTPAERVTKTGEAGLGIINAAFLPITAPLQGATRLPVVGSAAELINRFFGVLGTVGADVGEGAIEALPIKNETKKVITPLAQEVGALVAQIAAGKAGGAKKAAELKQKVEAIATHIDNGLIVADRVVKGGVPKKLPVEAIESTGTPTIGREVTAFKELQPLAAEAKKYKSAEEFVRNATAPGKSPNFFDEGTLAKGYETGRPLLIRDLYGPLTPQAYRTPGLANIVVKFSKTEKGPMSPLAHVEFEAGGKNPTIVVNTKFPFRNDVPAEIQKALIEEVEHIKTILGNSKFMQNGALDSTSQGYSRYIKDPREVAGKANAEKRISATLTDLWNKVNTTAEAPIEAKQVPNTRARTLEQAAIEKKLTETLGELPSHARMDMADQASLAADFIQKSPDEALRAARGDQTPPPGILPEALYTALEIKAIKEGNVELLRDLATSKVPTFAGQSLKALDSADPYSPVKIMRDLREARETALERRTGKKIDEHTKRVVSEIKREVMKSSSKRPTWEQFVKEIQC
jgi:hypothetical protein